jgi:chemotaxis protein CheD
VVTVSDMRISADPGDTLATYSLGSCIGVSAYDASARVGGLLHFQLPTSTLDPKRAQAQPLMFADSGVAAMLAALESAGARKQRLRVKLAGAAQILNDNNLFNIGRRNHAAVRKVLWQHGLFVDSEAIGGSAPRTMYLAIADGTVTVKTQGEALTL